MSIVIIYVNEENVYRAIKSVTSIFWKLLIVVCPGVFYSLFKKYHGGWYQIMETAPFINVSFEKGNRLLPDERKCLSEDKDYVKNDWYP